jgi:hypothetical protein
VRACVCVCACEHVCACAYVHGPCECQQLFRKWIVRHVTYQCRLTLECCLLAIHTRYSRVQNRLGSFGWEIHGSMTRTDNSNTIALMHFASTDDDSDDMPQRAFVCVDAGSKSNGGVETGAVRGVLLSRGSSERNALLPGLVGASLDAVAELMDSWDMRECDVHPVEVSQPSPRRWYPTM